MTHQITRLDNGQPSTDGSLVRFDMETKDGEVLPIEMPTKNIGNFVAFLCGLGQFASREKAATAKQRDVYEGPLVEASHIGFAKGRTDDETILAIQLGQFSIGVAIPNQGLAPLQQAASEISSLTMKPN